MAGGGAGARNRQLGGAGTEAHLDPPAAQRKRGAHAQPRGQPQAAVPRPVGWQAGRVGAWWERRGRRGKARCRLQAATARRTAQAPNRCDEGHDPGEVGGVFRHLVRAALAPAGRNGRWRWRRRWRRRGESLGGLLGAPAAAPAASHLPEHRGEGHGCAGRRAEGSGRGTAEWEGGVSHTSAAPVQGSSRRTTSNKRELPVTGELACVSRHLPSHSLHFLLLQHSYKFTHKRTRHAARKRSGAARGAARRP